jgi:ABC-type multidrug transport system ATPase subunit
LPLLLLLLLQASLAGSRSNRTTFIVAHRLSTIADANLIVVLKEGLVAEMGSHTELLAAGGLYAELWSKQAHTQEDASSSSTSRPGSTVNLQELEQQQQQQQRQQQNGAGGGSSGRQGAGVPPHHHHHGR